MLILSIQVNDFGCIEWSTNKTWTRKNGFYTV